IPVVFPRDNSNASVVDCVYASAAYPIVFRPIESGDSLYVDGGLASNLPSFLYGDQSRDTRLPTLAFDLVEPPSPVPRSWLCYCWRLLMTSLGASDVFLREVSDRILHVPIHLPLGIKTL